MPFRERARRTLQKAARIFGSSRSSSPAPAHRQPPRTVNVHREDPVTTTTAGPSEQSQPTTSEDWSARTPSAPPIEAPEHDSIFDTTPQGASSPNPTPNPPQQQAAILDEGLKTTPQEAPTPKSMPYADRAESVTTTRGPPQESQPATPHGKPTNTWYTALKATVDLVVQVSDVFPPLKSAAAGVKALMDVHEAFFDNQEEFEKLALRVKLLQDILRDRPATLPAGIKDRQDGLARAAEGLGKELEDKTEKSKLKRVVSANEGKQEILRLIRELNFAIEFAMLDVAVTNEGLTLCAVKGIDWLKVNAVEESQKLHKNLALLTQGVATLNKSDKLKKLGRIEGYGLSPDAPQCVAGSRVALIARLLAWAEDPASPHAFWLNGMAGTGKTAVSRTLCHQLIKRGLLGASFFCSIKVQDLSDVRNIIPSLAKTLAERHPKFGDALADILDSGNVPLVHEMKLSEQYDCLIVRPAGAALCDLDKNVILCTDALDECRASAALKEFLETILSKRPGGRLKFFFTSRPEVAIRQAVESPSHSLHRNLLRLHDIEKDIVRSDIKLYVNHELSKITELQEEYEGCWPPPEVDQIVERADALFIVAATIVRRISGDGESGNPVQRLQSFGRAGTSTGVQQLYLDIMEKATSGLEDLEKEDLRSCLSLLVAAQRPLSMTEYAALLGRKMSAIAASFRSLHSVVEVPTVKDNLCPISIYHASFVDFLTGYSVVDTKLEGSTRMSSWWTIDRREAHCTALTRCLGLMVSKEGLYLGVSSARTSYLSNEAQQLPRLRPDLAYACTSWGNHALDAKPMSDNLQRGMKVFLETKALYWLEALSVERSVEYSNILWHISKIVHLDGLARMLVSIRDFAQMFSTPITCSAPHTYLSAVPFWQAMLTEPQQWLPAVPSTIKVHLTSKHGDRTGGMSVETGEAVRCVDVSPDGSRVVAGCDRVILVFNMQSGEQMGSPMGGHSDSVTSVAFSPDGARIVSGSHDKTVRIWDAQSGEQMGSPMEGHSGWVLSVAFSPDGAKIVSGSGDKTVRIWDAQSGEQMGSPMVGHSDSVMSVAFSPDGTRIASGSDDTTVRIWDAQSGEQMWSSMQGHSDWVRSVAFSPDGTRIASGSDDRTIRIWDAQSGEQMGSPMQGHSDWVWSVAFSPDGARIVSGSGDKTVRIWDAQSGEQMGSPMVGHSDSVMSVAFSPDGTRIASGSDDTTVRIWDAQSGEQMGSPMQGHSDSVRSVAFSPDGARIVSGSHNKTVRIWDAQSGEQMGSAMQGHSDSVMSVAFSPDGARIVSGSDDTTIQIWDAQRGEHMGSPMQGHSAWVTSVAFSPDGARIVSGSGDETVRIWDAQSGEQMGSPMQGHSDSVWSVAFSPDGARIVSGSGDKTVRIWDAQSGEQMGSAMQGHSDSVMSVAFSPDGARIVSGSDDTTIQIWDAQRGEHMGSPMQGHSAWVTSVAFSPDGARIVSGSGDETVRIWDAQSGEQMGSPMQGHSGSVLSVAFSPDGARIVSGSRDKTVRIWDAQSGVQMGSTMQGHSDWVLSVAFSPDGARIVSGSADKTIRIWNALSNSPSELIYLHDCAVGSLSMDRDGWIRNFSRDLLLWVPPQFRDHIQLPSMQLVIPPIHQVQLSQALSHGVHWKECASSKPANPRPWPVTQGSSISG